MATRSLTLTVALAGIFAISAGVAPGARADDAQGWSFEIAPYVWAAGIEGDIAPFPSLPTASVDETFGDVVDNLDGALMLVGEAREDRFGVFGDLIYLKTEATDSSPGPLFSSISVRSESVMLTALGFYRAVDRPDAFVDLLAGARYWSLDVDLSFAAGLLPATKVSNEETWIDPMVGAKARTSLGGSGMYLSGVALVGGFNVGSDFTYDLNINLGYQWTENFSTTLGYRYLAVDYRDDGFVYDVSQDGPILGLIWRF